MREGTEGVHLFSHSMKVALSLSALKCTKEPRVSKVETQIKRKLTPLNFSTQAYYTTSSQHTHVFRHVIWLADVHHVGHAAAAAGAHSHANQQRVVFRHV